MLGTDYLDIWHLHHLNTAPEREQALGPGGAYEAAVKAREQGLVRFIGVTGHDWVEIGKAVATGLFDNVLCWYNSAMKEPEELIFPHTQRYNMGVAIMSAARNDKLFKQPDAPPPEAFYRYVLSHPAVHVALLGLRSVEVFRQVAAALSERDTLLPGEEGAAGGVRSAPTRCGQARGLGLAADWPRYGGGDRQAHDRSTFSHRRSSRERR